MSLRGRDIICVGIADWRNQLQTNEQHLLRRLAADNRILFVESLGLRQPQIAGRDLRRIARRLVTGLRGVREEEGVQVISPLVLPFHRFAAARWVNRILLPWLVARSARGLGFKDILLWSFVPQAEMLIESLQPVQILYYIDDDHAQKPGIDAASFEAAERRFAPRADVVLASAPAIVDRLSEFSTNVVYAPNVADTALFATALAPGPPDAALTAISRPRVVFMGALVAHTLDLPLLGEMCERRPGWSFVFVGPRGQGDPHTDISALERHPNAFLLGPRRYGELPAVLRGADAAMVPYRLTGAMRSVFPMKTYEYLAAGLGVVSTRLPALRDVPDITFADDAEGMIAALEQIIATDDDATRRARSTAAQSHSWESRLELIGDLLSDAG